MTVLSDVAIIEFVRSFGGIDLSTGSADTYDGRVLICESLLSMFYGSVLADLTVTIRTRLLLKSMSLINFDDEFCAQDFFNIKKKCLRYFSAMISFLKDTQIYFELSQQLILNAKKSVKDSVSLQKEINEKSDMLNKMQDVQKRNKSKIEKLQTRLLFESQEKLKYDKLFKDISTKLNGAKLEKVRLSEKLNKLTADITQYSTDLVDVNAQIFENVEKLPSAIAELKLKEERGEAQIIDLYEQKGRYLKNKQLYERDQLHIDQQLKPLLCRTRELIEKLPGTQKELQELRIQLDTDISMLQKVNSEFVVVTAKINEEENSIRQSELQIKSTTTNFNESNRQINGVIAGLEEKLAFTNLHTDRIVNEMSKIEEKVKHESEFNAQLMEELFMYDQVNDFVCLCATKFEGLLS